MPRNHSLALAALVVLMTLAAAPAHADRITLQDADSIIGAGCQDATFALAIPPGGNVIDILQPVEGEPALSPGGSEVATVTSISIDSRRVVWTFTPVACNDAEWQTDEIPFRVLANVPVRMLTRTQALRYTRELLVLEGYDGYGYQRRCSRQTRHRFRCYATWISGDTSMRARLTIWHSLDRRTGETFYRYRGVVRITNHYCQAVGRSNCVRHERIRR